MPFDSTTGTITDYGNDITNPSAPNDPYSRNIGTCPADVDIPGSIGGVGVTSIGDGAFAWDWVSESTKITAVLLPTGLTSIGSNAFSDNAITSLSVPGSVTTIGSYAFFDNKLTSLTLNEGLQTIDFNAFGCNLLTDVTVPKTLLSITAPNPMDSGVPAGTSVFGAQGPGAYTFWDSVPMRSYGTISIDVYNNSPSAQEALLNIWYLRLHLAEPSNPRGFIDNIAIGTICDWNSGTIVSTYTYGGDLIDAASTKINYTNPSGETLRGATVTTGLLTNGTSMTNYLQSNGPAIPPPADVVNPTPAELSAISQALTVYYRAGQHVTLDAPTIPGYLTPASIT